MIPTVLGPVNAAEITGTCSSREELLHRATPSIMKAIHENPITMENLGEARRSGEAGRLAASSRLFSLDESVQELALLKDAGGGLVAECSSATEGRDPRGLAEISRRSGLGIVMAASCKEIRGTIAKELEHQLLFGEHGDPSTSPSLCPSAAGAAKLSDGTPARIQAGFLLVKLNSNYSSSPITSVNNEGTTMSYTTAVRTPSAGDAQEVLSSSTVRELEGAVLAMQATGAPLVLACSHFVRWPTVEASLAIATASCGEPANGGPDAMRRKLIVAGMHGGVRQSLKNQALLLSKGIVLCFDCFGRVEWFPGPEYYPSDEESAVRIAELVRLGFADRIVVSSGVSRRIHLSRFGGHGYGHAVRTVPSRLLRLGVSAEDIALLTKGNMLRLLDWYTPPPPMEIPKDYLPCSWCKTRFEPVEGEYFHKFRFLYCSIKCLRAHRDTGFDAEAASSRTA